MSKIESAFFAHSLPPTTHTHTASLFRPTLLPTSVGVELSAIFPALLPTSFSLVIYYYDRDTSDLVGKSELFDLSFSNTRTVDYLISADKMPPVLSFSVRIAVNVGGIEGDSSSSSNTINMYVHVSNAVHIHLLTATLYEQNSVYRNTSFC